MPKIRIPSDDPKTPTVHTTSTGGSYITTLDAVTSAKGRAMIASHNRMWQAIRTNSSRATAYKHSSSATKKK